MQISDILKYIDNGHMALPEFQRGYVWNRGQVRGLFNSLYHRYPVGGLLVWATESKGAQYRGDGQLAPGVVKLLLDGQQRITSLYGVIRGKPPTFFDGSSWAFTDLRFHLEEETFEFYQPVKMRDDPLWVDVTDVMRKGTDAVGEYVTRLSTSPKMGEYVARLGRLLGITEIKLHIDEITGEDKSIDVVVEIFNRVNSSGTKLSKGDLALAKICADWPDARQVLKQHLESWSDKGYSFDMDWLLRSVNTVLTGEAQFSFLHGKTAEQIQDGLNRAVKQIDTCLTHIADRLGLDHDRVLFGRYAFPVMARYLDTRSGPMSSKEYDKLLFWFVQAGMWGRFSNSTETTMNQDIAVMEAGGDSLDNLIERLRLWHGARVEPGHFTGWSLGARFYPVLYMLTRMGGARDWGEGGPRLKNDMLGKMSQLEVHHIFPKSRLYDRGFDKSAVNDLANFCFLKKDTNLHISNRLPVSDQPEDEYFPEVQANHPDALASQWIPEDKDLWRIDNYRDFLEARRELLAAETNRHLQELLHGDTHWLIEPPEETFTPTPPQVEATEVKGGIQDEEEELRLRECNVWVARQGLPEGELLYELSDPESGRPLAVIDLAWPKGLQEGYSEPVALLINEDRETQEIVHHAGYHFFTDIQAFQNYVKHEVLAWEEAETRVA